MSSSEQPTTNTAASHDLAAAVDAYRRRAHVDPNRAARVLGALLAKPRRTWRSSPRPNPHLDGASSLGAYLVDHLGDNPAVNQWGQTPLHLCARHGHADVARHILESPCGATMIDAPDQRGRTPLMMAVRDSGDVARMLLARGCRVDATDAKNKNALHHAIKRGTPAAAANLDACLAAADPPSRRKMIAERSNKSRNPFQETVYVQSPCIVRFIANLMKHGDTHNILDYNGRNHTIRGLRQCREANETDDLKSTDVSEDVSEDSEEV